MNRPPSPNRILGTRQSGCHDLGAVHALQRIPGRTHPASAFPGKGIDEKQMFGGVGFLVNGNMLVGVWKESLIVRLDADQADEALKEPHVKPFDITGKPMKGWLLVAPEGQEGDEELADWIRRSVKLVGKFPAKEK